jgi:hypothetical protein
MLCRCLKDVNDRIEILKQPGETDEQQYDDHTLFQQEYDEQLLLWTQRYSVYECRIFLGFRSIFSPPPLKI